MRLFEFSELETWMVVYFYVLAFVLGAVFGSFLNCAAYRIARNQSFLKGRSICPKCNHTLGVKDLIPIFSFLFSKGRCRYCKEKISVRYPLTEVLFGLLSVLLLYHDGISVLFLRDFCFFCCLFCLSLVDIEIFEIPNGTVLIPIVAWVIGIFVLKPGVGDIIYYVTSGFVFGLAVLFISILLDHILKKESLGGGDIKLIFVIGLYLGAVAGLFSIILAAVLALIWIRGKEKIPFGPFLSAGAVMIYLFGDPLVQWYLNILQI